MNVVKEIKRINEKELELGLDYDGSWHAQYKNSAYVFVGNLDRELTEGDVICIMSQCILVPFVSKLLGLEKLLTLIS